MLMRKHPTFRHESKKYFYCKVKRKIDNIKTFVYDKNKINHYLYKI